MCYFRRHESLAGWSGSGWNWEQSLRNTPLPLLARSGSPLTALSSLEEGSGVQVSWGGNSSPEDPGETCIQP